MSSMSCDGYSSDQVKVLLLYLSQKCQPRI